MFLNKVYHNKSKNVNRQVKKYMDYLSVKETAEIKGCSGSYVNRLIKHNKIEYITEIHKSNGQKYYMIPVTALSEQEQAKYYKKIRQEAGFIPAPAEPEKNIKTGLKYNLKAVERSFESFSEKERDEIAFWSELLGRWQTERNAHQGIKTEFDKLFCAHQKYINPDIVISPDIMYRKLAAYKANCLEGLIDGRGGWNKGKSKLDDDSEIWEIFLQIFLDDSCKKIAECRRETEAYFFEINPETAAKMPSVDTFRRKVKTIPFAVLEYTRNGEKAMKDHCLPYAQRQKDSIQANDIWVMDNYTFDILCKNEDGVTETKRFYLTGVLDAQSGVFVGWNISDSPDSQSTLIALRNAMLRYGIPDWLYFDNGREFTAKDITGDKGARAMSDIPIPPSILSRLGINVKFAIVHNAQAKAIERAHNTFKNQFCRNFMGWCGGNILERRESLKRHIKNGVIETEHELRELFRQYADFVYNVQNWAGEEKKYKNMSRIDVWNASMEQRGIRMADSDTLNLLMMRTDGYQKIKRDGVFITVQGTHLWYYDESTYLHINEEVCVRYDPCNLKTVRIYDRDDRYLWTWNIGDYLIAEYIDEDSEHIAKFRRIEKGTMKKIRERSEEIYGKKFINRKSAMEYRIKRGKNMFAIHIPKNIIPVIVDEEPLKKAAGAENINVEVIDVNLNRMISNGQKRKER
ncbi:MAG TPA: hypothetical protein DCS38_03885 [Ruminococcus sp.]|nr:hypothetical protein [Ruminococcus sp.]